MGFHLCSCFHHKDEDRIHHVLKKAKHEKQISKSIFILIHLLWRYFEIQNITTCDKLWIFAYINNFLFFNNAKFSLYHVKGYSKENVISGHIVMYTDWNRQTALFIWP